MGRKVIDLVGQRFGRWTVLKRGPDKKSWDGVGHPAWICRCDCGTVRLVNGASLRRGISLSCGCYRSEVTSRGTKEFNQTRDYSQRRPKGYARQTG
jgi:hypothetical protein